MTDRAGEQQVDPRMRIRHRAGGAGGVGHRSRRRKRGQLFADGYSRTVVRHRGQYCWHTFVGRGHTGCSRELFRELDTVHTRTSLIFPAGAKNMPFTTDPRKGGEWVNVDDAGAGMSSLAVFHP